MTRAGARTCAVGLWAALMWAPALVGSAGAQDEAPDRIATLVAQLGAPAFAAREQAEAGLRDLGEAALPALRAAAGHADPEVRHRAKRLRKAIGDVPEEDLQGLRTSLLRALREATTGAEAVERIRDALVAFRAAHPLRAPGTARTCRSGDGRVVVVLGRDAIAKEAPGGGDATAADYTADVVVAFGGAGCPAVLRGGNGGGAEARAGRGVACALAGDGGDSHAEVLPDGVGWKIGGQGQPGAVAAHAPMGGLAYAGSAGALCDPQGKPMQPRAPAALPEIDAPTWARLRAFAAATKG